MVSDSPYPRYQRCFLACNEELRRPQADTSSADGRIYERLPKPETEHEKPLAPRVDSPGLVDFAIGLMISLLNSPDRYICK